MDSTGKLSVTIDVRGVPELMAKLRMEVASTIRRVADRQRNLEVAAALHEVAAEIAQDVAEKEAAEAVKGAIGGA